MTETGSSVEFGYRLLARDGAARRGRVTTAHGAIETPAFMPVGTAATVKAMRPADVRATGAEIVLSNTYHLMLRPGAETIARLGGLHAFMAWSGPILTDSGGYQVMSLAQLRKLDEDGVTFKSHIDGSLHKLTPERAVEIQDLLDADITMQLDECPQAGLAKDKVAESMLMSLRWAERCRKAFRERPGYALFGIVQGGVFDDLRRESARALADMDLPGYAVGGLAVGEGQDEMFRVLDVTTPEMPDNKPRYLMGVGRPSDIIGAVMRGIDMFDCVLPTRSGRTAQAFTAGGTVNLRNSRHREDPRPLDPACGCPTCATFTRAYLHHLFRAEEMLGPMLLTQHNLCHYQNLMAGLRTAIEEGRLAAYAAEVEARERAGDLEPLGAIAGGR
ncbi:tRNA guanosine(34) transglycosylase Tgt [Ferruginivarius sediminum]|uniref:Queuine tRNA-ribosyltransferase n=1 Tax=Ferruginivarius sediminum TaxID=2661937 RepID=A0A369T5T5_9PROT|nr:tRNA guanosine(34) transglycosylase Tgt [Ferruginivarius sediminum]RDD60681.1 tRNA guanosine(34) transglycosylase Tgt [Ferruginivarius sediminum]